MNVDELLTRLETRAPTVQDCAAAAAEIKRLRGAEARAVRAEAASEIERLRAALEDVLPLAESYLAIMPDRHGIHIPKLEAARAALKTGE